MASWQADSIARARHSDPWTSHAAARSVKDLRESQRDVLEAFAVYGPQCHEDLAALYDAERIARHWKRQSVSGLRTRTHELVAAGFLRDSGRVTVLESGRKAIVWELCPLGEAGANAAAPASSSGPDGEPDPGSPDSGPLTETERVHWELGADHPAYIHPGQLELGGPPHGREQ